MYRKYNGLIPIPGTLELFDGKEGAKGSNGLSFDDVPIHESWKKL